MRSLYVAFSPDPPPSRTDPEGYRRRMLADCFEVLVRKGYTELPPHTELPPLQGPLEESRKPLEPEPATLLTNTFRVRVDPDKPIFLEWREPVYSWADLYGKQDPLRSEKGIV